MRKLLESLWICKKLLKRLRGTRRRAILRRRSVRSLQSSLNPKGNHQLQAPLGSSSTQGQPEGEESHLKIPQEVPTPRQETAEQEFTDVEGHKLCSPYWRLLNLFILNTVHMGLKSPKPSESRPAINGRLEVEGERIEILGLVVVVRSSKFRCLVGRQARESTNSLSILASLNKPHFVNGNGP